MRRAAQLPLPWPRTQSSTREDLVVGSSNRLAVSAIEAWPNWPHPVLYVFGPEGSGKSHLAASFVEATGAVPFEPSRFDPQARGFTVVLDDLDRTNFAESDLFSLLNAARLGGGTVLLTARVKPVDLAFRTPDLRSRIGAATVVPLGLPDDELLAAVLAKHFADRQIEFDPRLISTVLPRVERSLKAVRDLVERIDRESLAAQRRPTRRLVLDLLEEDAEKSDDPS